MEQSSKMSEADRLTTFEVMAIKAIITVSTDKNPHGSEGYLDSWCKEFYRIRKNEAGGGHIKPRTLDAQFRRAVGGLRGKGFVRFANIGPILTGVGDQAAVNFAIISSKGAGCMTGA